MNKIQQAVDSYNFTNSSAVGAPPNMVSEDNSVLNHLLIKANSRKLEVNAQVFLRNSKLLEKGSKFRVLVKEKNIRGLRRGFKPSFSGKVYVVSELL